MHTINATSKNWNSKQKDRKHTTIHRAQPTLNGLNGREGNKKHKYTHNSVLLQQTHTRDEKKNHTERTNERTSDWKEMHMDLYWKWKERRHQTLWTHIFNVRLHNERFWERKRISDKASQRGTKLKKKTTDDFELIIVVCWQWSEEIESDSNEDKEIHARYSN